MVPAGAQRSVGRPREFDEETVLERAMEAFWEKGYEATSLADLCQCTGLHKGSLYQAFGDKHQLFMRALKHYADTEFRETAAVAFNSDSPIENIRAVLHKVCDDSLCDQGCMMINSMVELAPHDPEVRKLLNSAREQRERVMTDMIAKGQALGEIRDDVPAERLALQLMVTMAGAAASVKGFIDNKQARIVLDQVLDCWAPR